MNNIYRIILATVLMLFLMTGVYGQIQSKNALTYIIGKGYSDSPMEFFGEGYQVGAGYQLNVWKDRLRFNPTLIFGQYTTKMYTDVPDEMYTAINLEVPLYFDVIRYKSLALFIGAGGVLQRKNGLMGTGGLDFPVSNSYYMDKWNVNAFMGCGISYNPRKSCFYFTFQPFNFYLLEDNYEYFSRIGFGIKLPNKPAR